MHAVKWHLRTSLDNIRHFCVRAGTRSLKGRQTDVDATITPHRRRYDATIASCIRSGLFIKSCPRLHAEQTAYCNTTIVYRKPESFDKYIFFSNLD